MNHEQIQNKLSAFHDGELPETELREIAGHLSECADCCQRVKPWGRIGEGLSRANEFEHSEYFVHQTMARLADLEKDAAKTVPVSFGLPKWVFPTVGYAFALTLVFVAVIAREPVMNDEANTETVLLTHVPQGTQWTFSSESPEIGKLLDIKEEV